MKLKDKKEKCLRVVYARSIGTSVSTLERIRYDLGVPSPYRYEKSIKSEAQKEKEKLKRIVYSALKSGEIDETRKTELYSRINSDLNADVKHEVRQLKAETKTITKSFTEILQRIKEAGMTTRPGDPGDYRH